MKDITISGMVLSSTVVETIVALAVKNVEGVVGLSGSDQTAGPIARLFASARFSSIPIVAAVPVIGS